MSRKPTTEGIEWLQFSMLAFNGSGYAHTNSAEAYIESYIAYWLYKGKKTPAALAHVYRQEMLPVIEKLLKKTKGAGRTPSSGYKQKFEAYQVARANQKTLL